MENQYVIKELHNTLFIGGYSFLQQSKIKMKGNVILHMFSCVVFIFLFTSFYTTVYKYMFLLCDLHLHLQKAKPILE
jgi:hypothetical protein